MARDARTVIELTQAEAAIHLLALCQAVDPRGPQRAAPLVRRAYEAIRCDVPFVDRNRRMDRDVQVVVELIAGVVNSAGRRGLTRRTGTAGTNLAHIGNGAVRNTGEMADAMTDLRRF